MASVISSGLGPSVDRHEDGRFCLTLRAPWAWLVVAGLKTSGVVSVCHRITSKQGLFAPVLCET